MTTHLPAQTIRCLTLDGQENAPAPAVQADGFIHQVKMPALEIYPASSAPSKGTILISPGGGYEVLAIGYEGREVAALLNAAGWDAAVLIYHVSAGAGTRGLALADATKALELLQTRGREFGLSTSHIGALGFSAGGHLTARLAHEMASDHRAPAFLALFYPAYLEEKGKILSDVAPTGVPIFLCVGGQDHHYLPSSQALAAFCKEKDFPCQYLVAPDAGHGFGLKATLPGDTGDVPKALRAFLASLPG